MSMSAFIRRQGRIMHDLSLYVFMSNLALQNEHGDIVNPFNIEHEAFTKGWGSGSDVTRKQLMRSLFNSSVIGNIIVVNQCPFTLIYNGMQYTFPGGVVRTLEMGCFPLETMVIIHTCHGNDVRQNVGTPIPSRFGAA